MKSVNASVAISVLRVTNFLYQFAARKIQPWVRNGDAAGILNELQHAKVMTACW